jgi:hypothetical protein
LRLLDDEWAIEQLDGELRAAQIMASRSATVRACGCEL